MNDQPLPMFDDAPAAEKSPKKPKPKPTRQRKPRTVTAKPAKRGRPRKLDMAKAGGKGRLSEKLTPAQLEVAWSIMQVLQKFPKDERAFILTAVRGLYA